MGGRKKDDIPWSGLARTALVGLFGWLLYTVHGMDGLLRETANRTDRIAAVLGDFGRSIAWEELNKQIDSFLVTLNPVQINDGWFTYIILTNPLEKNQKVYKVNVANQNDLTAANTIAGAVQRFSTEYRSYFQMGTWSAELERAFSLQPELDQGSSFIFHQGISPTLEDYFTDYAGPPEIREFSDLLNNWSSILEYTNVNVTKAAFVLREDET